MIYHLVQDLNKDTSKELIDSWKFGARKVFKAYFIQPCPFKMENMKPEGWHDSPKVIHQDGGKDGLEPNPLALISTLTHHYLIERWATNKFFRVKNHHIHWNRIVLKETYSNFLTKLLLITSSSLKVLAHNLLSNKIEFIIGGY